MNNHLTKRIDLDIKDDKKVSSSAKDTEDVETTHHTWIMCSSNSDSSSNSTSTIGYDCHPRPYMTVFLLLSILVFIILRKSTFIKNWVTSHQEKLQEQTDEEEGLMERVVNDDNFKFSRLQKKSSRARTWDITRVFCEKKEKHNVLH